MDALAVAKTLRSAAIHCVSAAHPVAQPPTRGNCRMESTYDWKEVGEQTTFHSNLNPFAFTNAPKSARSGSA